MVGYRQVASTSFNHGSSGPQRNGFHITRKPFFSFNGSNFKGQNQRGSDSPRASHMHANLENGLDNDVKFRMIVRRIGAGLENLGNTCFLNSVLQCLTYTEPLVAYLLSGKHQKSCHIVGFCALCAIQNHVSRALQSTGRIVAPKDLVSNLRRISRNFRNSRQEDAHEYMVHLLESMHKCCLPSGVPYESPSAHEKSLVHNIFGGSLRSQVKCMQCSYGSNKFDPFLDLSLEINKADSLHKALNHFTAPEMLDGGERQYMCQQCKQKVRALKQLTIDKAPFVLTVHLKRFGSHISGQKIDKKVQFGPVLNLKPYVSGSHEGELKYTLYGVLVHAGWSTHSGHYYCFVRTSSGIWYSLDDNRVRQVSERTVLEQKAYMLFYVRDGMNFGAGNIASAMQSKKMVQPTMPNGASCSSTAAHGHMSIDKPVNAPQKEKAVAATVGNGLASTAATSQSFLNKDDGKSAVGVEKEKILATALQKRSSEKDSEGSLQNSSPAKKFRSADSDALVHQNLPNVQSLEKHLSNEDSLPNPKTVDLSQSSVESKESDSVLKENVQHSTHLRKCTGGEPSADNEGAKIFEPVTSVTSDDKNSKTDLLVSVAKASEGLADTVIDMVQKSSCDKGGAPEETMAKESVENNNNVGQPNGAVISVNEQLSNASSHKSHQKLNKKPSKYAFPSMHLGTRILYGASLSLQKRKKHKKVKKVNQKLVAKNLKDEKLGPSTSLATASVEVRSKISKKRPKCGSKKSSSDHVKLDAKNLKDEKSGPSTSDVTAAIEVRSNKSRKRSKCGSRKVSSDHVKHDGVSAHENLVSELTKRTSLGNTALTGDSLRLKSGEMQQQDVQISHLKDSMLTSNVVTDKPITNVESNADGRCNGIELPSSQTVEVHSNIGYVADEWDEEYVRGKRKKVKISKDTFGGPNPFQKIATKAAKLKGKHKHKQYSLANQPFRI